MAEAWEKTVAEIALKTFGSRDGIRPLFPSSGEKIQEAMEAAFKAGYKQGVEDTNRCGQDDYQAGEQAERERILNWLKGFAKEHPNVVVRNRLDIVGAGKPRGGLPCHSPCALNIGTEVHPDGYKEIRHKAVAKY